MKKNKKKLVITLLVTFLLILVILLICFRISYKNKNSLTLSENKWIDENKYNVVDVALMNDVPILSYDGNGLVYNYIDYITEKFSLKFNIIPYKLDDSTQYEYKMDIVYNPSEKDIILLKDNMILITNNNLEYKNIEDINNLRIGILSEDRSVLSEYFNGVNIEFVEYNSYSELKNAITESRINLSQNINTTIDGIIISKTIFTKEIIENNYKISFQFNDLKKYFVLTTNGETELNSILNKSYNVWKENNYEDSYNSNLLDNYLKFKNVSDVEEKTLKSKSYVYGFIDYGIYNYLDKNKISGLSGLILKDFNKFSGLSLTYTKYNGINTLLKDFNDKNIDFMLNIVDSSQYTNDVYNTVGVFNKNLVIISGVGNHYVIDNLYSLKDKEVLIVKNLYLEKDLISKGINIKSYNNMNDLVKDFKYNDIAIVDLENYNFYKSSYFKNSRINYLLTVPGKYDFVINNTEENKIFEELFNFYISFVSVNELVSLNYDDIAYENNSILYILIIIIVVLCIYLFVDFYNHIKAMLKTVKKNKKVHLSKEDKIKYIDQLTSLKNRAYLNSKIELWDDSEVYPQAIIIIDLNNISYINDNYGREEGDKVITEAANILILHQLQNSEIIRTDGNEFLIYLVGYNEKQIISYLRKLNKELKGLSHGFGAASGYSIITDAIKTVDDAVNEATLDMKNNKEDIDY